MNKIVVINPVDNVATCLTDMKTGDEAFVTVQDNQIVLKIKTDIPFGHKVALMDIKAGTNVTKYAEVIGTASQKISAGEHVHVHNLEGIRGRGDIA